MVNRGRIEDDSDVRDLWMSQIFQPVPYFFVPRLSDFNVCKI